MSNSGKILCEFSVYSAGVFFMFTGSSALEALQSSINVVGHAGSNSLVASYVASILFGLLFAPSIIERIGVKTALVVGEVGYTAFVVANFFTNEYVLLAGGIVRGLGNSLLWPSVAVLNGMYARAYSQQRSQSSHHHHLISFSSIFFIVFHLNQVFGNAISFFILDYRKSNHSSLAPTDDITKTPPSLPFYNLSTTSTVVNYSQVCGPHDCQLKEYIDENLQHYLPMNHFVRSVLIIAFVSVKIIGIGINAFVSPRICSAGREIYVEDYHVIGDNHGEVRKSTSKTAKEFVAHLVHPLTITLAPLTIYSGMLLAFTFNDLTRAYVSCVDGVTSVDIYMTMFGIASAVSLIFSGKISKSGRFKVIAFAVLFLLDIGNLISCQLWTIHMEKYTVYINFIMFGISLGIWQPVLMATHLKYFHGKKSALASTFWNSFTLLGMTINRCAPVCVWKKLYSLIGVLVIGIIFYGFGERRFHRHKKDEERRSLLVEEE